MKLTMQVKGASDHLRSFFSGFTKTKNSSIVFRGKKGNLEIVSHMKIKSLQSQRQVNRRD